VRTRNRPAQGTEPILTLNAIVKLAANAAENKSDEADAGADTMDANAEIARGQ
jgi:hypothetical protein